MKAEALLGLIEAVSGPPRGNGKKVAKTVGTSEREPCSDINPPVCSDMFRHLFRQEKRHKPQIINNVPAVPTVPTTKTRVEIISGNLAGPGSEHRSERCRNDSDVEDADKSFLRAEKGVAYPCMGTVWPDHECVDPPAWADLFERLRSAGVKFSVERGHLTRWSLSRLDRGFIDEIAAHRETLLAAADGHSVETVVLEVEPWPAADDDAGSVAEDRFAQEAADQKNGAAALA